MSAGDLENENLDLKLQLATKRAESEKYRSQLELLSKNLDHMVRVEADLNGQLAMVTRVIGDNKAEIDDLTFRIGSADVEIKLYRDELQDLRNKLLDSEKEAKSLREQLEDLKSGAFISHNQTKNSINSHLSKSHAQEDYAEFGVGHDLIHDHDHQETVTKIQSLEKLIEELHTSLHQAEEENGTLRSLVNKKSSNSKEQNVSDIVDTVMSIKTEMAAQLKSKDEEIINLKKEHDTALYNLKATKEEELFTLRKSSEEKISQLQKSLEEMEEEKLELQQQCDVLHAKQEYFCNIFPPSFMKTETFANVTMSTSTTNRDSNLEIIGSQSSLEKALKMYVTEGKNDEILQELNKLVLKFEKQKLRNTILLNKLQSARGNIQVCCRTRPPSSDELTGRGKVIIDGHDGNELSCYDWKIESWKPFIFDHVWPPEASQADVFSDVEPLIASVAEGFNVCIFAYGQTGSGKTYTMEGYGTDYGIYYRSIQKLFKLVHAKSFGASGFVGTSTTAPTSASHNTKRTMSSHLPSSAHASATQRRHSISQLPQTNNLSLLEKVFGSDSGNNRSSNSSNSKASSFRSDSSDISAIIANELSDAETNSLPTAAAVSATNTLTAPSAGGNKTLTKLPSLFEFSNPISRRRSSLHISASSEVKKEPVVDEYNFLNERDDSHQLMKVKIEMSMLEIYNEQVYDLLTDRWISSSNINNNAFSSTGGNSNSNNNSNNGNNYASMALDLRQGTDGQVMVHGLSTIEVKDMHEAMAVFARGASNRATASTQLNAHSSRSHLIVQIDVITEGVDDTAGIHSKLFLVDLAGSERIEKSGATGSVLKEAQYINKSLLALGDVMEALDKKQSHIPYRNSKLTHLLQNALGGNARCMMIANVCPTDLTYDETLFTLQFATRVRNINLGVAHRNSNVKNLEEALKVTRAENRELKRKRQVLEEALNIAKKEGNAGKLGDKFSEAKIRQLEETKKVADTLIQHLQKQLHEANAKMLEERRLREQAAVDAELLQRNLKKAMEQLKYEQEKSRRVIAGTSLSITASSAVANKSTPVRNTQTTAHATPNNTTSHNKIAVSPVPTAVSASSVSRSPNHSHTTTASAGTTSSLPITPGSAFSKRFREGSPATATATNTVTRATKHSTTTGSNNNSKVKTPAASTVATSAALSTKYYSTPQQKISNSKISDNSSVITSTTYSSIKIPATSAAVPKEDTAIVPSPLSSPSSEAKRSNDTSPYKAAFAAMMQKQQQQVQKLSSLQSPSSKKPADVDSNKTAPVPARAKSLLEQSMDESSDEEIFEVFIPDAVAEEKTHPSPTDDKKTKESNEQERLRHGLGERKVSLDMILDDLSVASVDDESLTELSQSTGTGSHISHATSTLAQRIARNNPGLFHPGMVDHNFLTSTNATQAKQSPVSASKRARNNLLTPTHSPAGQPRHRQPLISPSSNTSPRRVVASAGSSRLSHSPAGSRGAVTPSTNHTPVSRGSSAQSSPAAVSTASARAAMVTTSSPAYRKPLPTSNSPSRMNNNNNNHIKTPIVVSTRAPFNLNDNASSAAHLRQVIHSVSSPAPAANTSAGTSGTSSSKRSLLKTPLFSSTSHTPGSTGSSKNHSSGLSSRVSTTTLKTPPATSTTSHPSTPHSASSANKTPPSISERAKAALDIHKNRMALREAEKTEVTRSMKFLDKSTRK